MNAPIQLHKNASVVILTGAGISAESGLETFRGAGGLWCGHKVEDVATPEAFARNPALVHEFYNMRRTGLLDPAIRPNRAHLALVELENKWPGDVLIVTQNIDDLHERAGSKNLIHMHGEVLRAFCHFCHHKIDIRENLSVEIPCAKCSKKGGVRPDIVWFGETPYQRLDLSSIHLRPGGHHRGKICARNSGRQLTLALPVKPGLCYRDLWKSTLLELQPLSFLRFFILLLGLVFFAAPASALSVDQLRFGVHDGKTRLVLDLSESSDFRVFVLGDPYRLVIDLPDFDWRAGPLSGPPDTGVKGVRHGNLQPGVSRIVLDINRPIGVHSAFMLPRQGEKPDRLVIDFGAVRPENFRQEMTKIHGTLTANAPVNSYAYENDARTASSATAPPLTVPLP